MIGDVKGKQILDIGCGFGDHLHTLSKQKPTKIIGFDLSNKMIDIANSFKIPNSVFYVHNMKNGLEEKENTIDVAFSSLAIHYISPSDLDKLFSEVHRVLKQGGAFLFSTGHPIFALRKSRISESMKNQENGFNIHMHYFNEGPHQVELGSTIGKCDIYNFTFETLIKTSLKNNFEIIDYKDVKPIDSAKGFPKYDFANNMPTFIIFKLRKK